MKRLDESMLERDRQVILQKHKTRDYQIHI